MKSKIIISLATLTIVLSIVWPTFAVPPAPILLDPKIIPKYVNQITRPPPVYDPIVAKNSTTGQVIGHNYTIFMNKFRQPILPSTILPLLVQLPGDINPPDGKTEVWGYNGSAKDAITGASLGYFANSPGATFEAVRGISVNVTWVNNITTPHMFAVDPTLHWANPNGMPMDPPMPWPTLPPYFPAAQYNVTLIPHLHGGEVQSTSDGHPEAWFTYNGIHGPKYNTATSTYPNAAVFHYPNMQPPTTLWYHDHALGITRINVMSGLAGFYILRDDSNDLNLKYLPSKQYEMPLVIQDRTFKANGELWFPDVGINPTIHPYWMPEFFGNTIMVNGLVWPNMNVEKGVYRFRLLEGSNARFYTISFWIPSATILGIPNKLPFTVIGSDGGYLRAPVTLTELTIAPGERWDILVDFSNVPATYIDPNTGLITPTTIILRNTAKAPFPKGAAADPQTVGQIMQFTMQNILQVPKPQPLLPGTILNPALVKFPSLPATKPDGSPLRQRTLTLIEMMGPAGPTEILLDGKKWAAPISENVTLGSTEEWVIVNPTADAHPIHLHLVQFQLLSRQSFQVSKYLTDWWIKNPTAPIQMGDTTPIISPPYQNYLQGKAVGSAPHEQGWKDTIQVYPGEVTIIRVRFAPIDGSPKYPFDPTVGPGYVWHCHILDHEDNEMMRPYLVVP